jgi:hypothetical protein
MSPINYKLYPSNWKEIRARILERADNRCEQCKALNHDYVFRGKLGDRDVYQLADAKVFDANDGTFITEDPCCVDQVGDREFATRIVLTISHTDHDISNNDDGNLKALCQRCHLKHDHPHHIANAKKTREKKMGTINMFP